MCLLFSGQCFRQAADSHQEGEQEQEEADTGREGIGELGQESILSEGEGGRRGSRQWSESDRARVDTYWWC